MSSVRDKGEKDSICSTGDGDKATVLAQADPLAIAANDLLTAGTLGTVREGLMAGFDMCAWVAVDSADLREITGYRVAIVCIGWEIG